MCDNSDSDDNGNDINKLRSRLKIRISKDKQIQSYYQKQIDLLTTKINDQKVEIDELINVPAKIATDYKKDLEDQERRLKNEFRLIVEDITIKLESITRDYTQKCQDLAFYKNRCDNLEQLLKQSNEEYVDNLNKQNKRILELEKMIE